MTSSRRRAEARSGTTDHGRPSVLRLAFRQAGRTPAVLVWVVLVLLVAPMVALAGNRCAGGGQPLPDEGGIGGTGARPAVPGNGDSGIGGTGAHPPAPDDDDSGVGGTGISSPGDTGIIGTITGFASICVGEVEIAYGADTPVRIDGQAAAADRLAVGQVVEVVASGSGDAMSARQISVHHIVSGVVTGVNAELNQIDVIGQTVQLVPPTRANGSGADAAGLSEFLPQTFVQVSGMRRGDGVIVASRISRSDAPGVTQLSGPLARSDAGALEIAGTPVHSDRPPTVPIGGEVRVVGRWDGTALVAQLLEAVPAVPFDGRVARVDIEGYAHRSATGQLLVGPFVVELPAAPPDTLQQPVIGDRVRVQAVMQDRHVIAEGIGVIGDRPSMPDGGSRGPGPDAFNQGDWEGVPRLAAWRSAGLPGPRGPGTTGRRWSRETCRWWRIRRPPRRPAQSARSPVCSPASRPSRARFHPRPAATPRHPRPASPARRTRSTAAPGAAGGAVRWMIPNGFEANLGARGCRPVTRARDQCALLATRRRRSASRPARLRAPSGLLGQPP